VTTTELTPTEQMAQATTISNVQQQQQQISYTEFATLSDDQVLAKTQYALKVALGRQLSLLEQCKSSQECAIIANAVSNIVLTLKACKQ
jgi:hypothetical protein